MTAMPTAHPALGLTMLIALLTGVAISTARLVRYRHLEHRCGSYLTGSEADAGHLVMNLVMATMLGPWSVAQLRVGVLGVLALLTTAFGALLIGNLVRPSGSDQSRRATLVYHLLAAATMVYTAAAMPAGMADMGSSTPIALNALAVVFALDAVVTAAIVLAAPDIALAATARPAPRNHSRSRTAPATTAGVDRNRLALRVASVPHLAMDMAMVLMLLNLL
jgi:hypothetical protein